MATDRPPENVIDTLRSVLRLFRWVGVLVFVVGLCFFAWTALTIVLGQDVDGVVVAIEVERSAGGKGESHRPVVQFLDPATRGLTRQKISGGSFSDHFVGEQLSLRYWPATGSLVINSFFERWSLPIFLCMFGAAFLSFSKLMSWAVIDYPKRQSKT